LSRVVQGRLPAWLLACVMLSLSCGGGTTLTDATPVDPPALARIDLTAPVPVVSIGGTLQLTATPRDQSGRVVTATLTWTSTTPSVATVTSTGLVTALTSGATTIQATSGAVSARLAITVTGPITYTAGQSYLGRNGYIEYIAGNAPVILTAPHGGALTPSTIPDRTAALCGGTATTVTDANTQDLVRSMQQRFFARHGTYPHVIISLLSRRKLDPNRLPTEAACNNADALVALEDWHGFIDGAKQAVLQTTGKGWYMDIHGHGHAAQRLELGYLLSANDLDRADATLDGSATFENTSSIRTLSQFSPLSFSALLRGANSLGTLYATNGFPSVPSASDPSPNGAEYFNGGDNTVRHACGSGSIALGGLGSGNICGVQIEANFTGVRDTPANRERFADVTATVLESYLRIHWGVRLSNE
jgi:Bacterial Ig-like domain (group 2)